MSRLPIASTIDKVFAKYPKGYRFPIDWILLKTLSELNVSPIKWEKAHKQAETYIKANCTSDKSKFVIIPGLSGGVCLRKDYDRAPAGKS